jgi:hypothetical protein
MTIEEILAGRPVTKDNIYQVMRDDPRASGLSGKTDLRFMKTLEDALKRIDESEAVKARSIPFERSEVLQRPEALTVEFLRRKMADKRYCGTVSECDPDYIKAIEDGFKELFPEEIGQIQPGRTEKKNLLSGYE